MRGNRVERRHHSAASATGGSSGDSTSSSSRRRCPPPAGPRRRVAQHLRDLASPTFAIRQQAYVALEKSGEQAGHLLQEAIKNPPSLEVKRRLEMLLEKLECPLDEPAHLHAYRCLTLLQRIGTPEARQVLEELARGAPAAWLTIEARHALNPASRARDP